MPSGSAGSAYGDKRCRSKHSPQCNSLSWADAPTHGSTTITRREGESSRLLLAKTGVQANRQTGMSTAVFVQHTLKTEDSVTKDFARGINPRAQANMTAYVVVRKQRRVQLREEPLTVVTAACCDIDVDHNGTPSMLHMHDRASAGRARNETDMVCTTCLASTLRA